VESVRPRRLTVTPRATAVVSAATTWDEFPRLWRVLLDEVREQGASGRNVMLYKDDVPNVEVGVLPRGDFTPGGRVIRSQLPGGDVVAFTHRGPYEALGDAHEAVIRFCAEHGLTRAGPRWEIYGPWREPPDQPETEVVHLLR
jgi:effector-binding domain-containing protein